MRTHAALTMLVTSLTTGLSVIAPPAQARENSGV